MRLLRYGGDRRALRAFEERQALVRAGLTRRDLAKMGLLTGGGAVGGTLLRSEKGLARGQRSAAALGALPPLAPFAQPLTVLPRLRPRTDLSPAPTPEPNKTPGPDGLPVEGRTEKHVSEDIFPPREFYVTRMAATQARIHPDHRLPVQTFWGFNDGDPTLSGPHAPTSPGPVLVMHMGTPFVVRRYNQLPAPGDNGGFGVPEVSTHLHNFHSGTDSDGGPCDPKEQRFFFRGQFRDYYHNMQFAGWDSTNPEPGLGGVRGDPDELLGFLWYHDHRVDHTAENTYKGLVGPAIIFNALDTGDESTGLHLPSFRDKDSFDIPLVFADKLFDPTTGLLAFDTFSFDGLLGNVFLVNGLVQPFFEVQQRRYRFRLLDAGPSRFYEFFLTNPDDLSQSIPFWVLSNDGNLLPRPIKALSYQVGVAERTDILVDFARIAREFGASRLRVENRLEQVNGRGPTGKILPAGQGDQLLEFRITGPAVSDGSVDLDTAAGQAAYNPPALPDISQAQPRITRTFDFQRGNGQWQINGKFMDCTQFRFHPQMNTFERWIIKGHGGWTHPVHIHFEEFRILSRNGRRIGPGDVEFSRKDVMRVGGEEVEILIRFRDMVGGYPIHCHNTVHEDHQMMMIYSVSEQGDNVTEP